MGLEVVTLTTSENGREHHSSEFQNRKGNTAQRWAAVKNLPAPDTGFEKH